MRLAAIFVGALVVSQLGCFDGQSAKSVRRTAAIPWIAKRPTPDVRPHVTAPACRSDQLRATITFQGATGAQVGGIVFRNVSHRACSLLGRPGIRFTGGGAARVPWPVRRTRGVGGPPQPGHAFPALRALRHGESASVLLWWTNWCGPGSRPSYGVNPPPAAVVVTLPRGGGTLRVGVDTAPRCDLPGDRSTLSVGPFEPYESQPRASSHLPLAATIVDVPKTRTRFGKPVGFRLHRGQPFAYRVRLTNASPKRFVFHTCPRYVESVDPRYAEVYVLNCQPVRVLAPHASAVFRMVVHVPRTVALGATDIYWELAPRTADPQQTSTIAHVVP